MTHENQNKVKKEGGMFFVGVTMKSCEILKINVGERGGTNKETEISET